jgi:hypothetical protein
VAIPPPQNAPVAQVASTADIIAQPCLDQTKNHIIAPKAIANHAVAIAAI